MKKKRPPYIVPEDGAGRGKFANKADLLASLDGDEQGILKEFPHVGSLGFRAVMPQMPSRERERIAIQLYDRLQALLEALQSPDTPAWKSAALAMRYQDLLTIYRQPQTASDRGKAYSDYKKPRQAMDELCMRVMNHLRQQGKSWNETRKALEFAAERGDKICRVAIEIEDNHCYFSPDGRYESNPKDIERFTWTTLRDKKFREAKSD